ncbi:hypothetical protein O6H91_13G024700 [Diphasiastrum complanatum]|uniref:Uncharacterized protein n=1 Tax=Diphasiastrum complanatum TaxID=34168 RepID=A0ACC2BT15_DIPCM|nr:hypothetical protein O6H91_13G024700 [Diphasiastrum complanatum]
MLRTLRLNSLYMLPTSFPHYLPPSSIGTSFPTFHPFGAPILCIVFRIHFYYMVVGGQREEDQDHGFQYVLILHAATSVHFLWSAIGASFFLYILGGSIYRTYLYYETCNKQLTWKGQSFLVI